MILLVDIGNSRIKWCLEENGSLTKGGNGTHNATLCSNDLDRLWCTLEPPESVWGVNVSNPKNSLTIEQWSLEHWGIQPSFVSAGTHMDGVVNGYRRPEQLGADRWVAMIGASHLYGGACCIADCGTAVTIDCLDDTMHHLGGLILPGVSLMSRCVITGTARVTDATAQTEVWGRDTGSCVAAGATQAVVATLQRASELLQMQLGRPITRIITGGDAQQLLPLLDECWRYVPDLVFVGLSRIAAEQRSK